MTGFAGTRTAGPIFAAWAVLQYLGWDGYTRLAQHLLELKSRMINGINAIDGLKAWNNDLFPLVFESQGLDLTAIKAGLSHLGWTVLGCAEPPLINIALDAGTDQRMVDTFLADLASVVDSVRSGAIKEGEALRY
jgi:glutamate/tyrosine decarboxylase-like PLP-dependent enzyme